MSGPALFQLGLAAFGGAMRGRTRAREADEEQTRFDQGRADRLAESAARVKADQEARALEATRYADTQQRQKTLDARQVEGDRLAGYEKGFLPAEQVHQDGQQVAQAGAALEPYDQSGVGLGLRVAGQQASRAPEVYQIAGQAMAKGRESIQEAAAREARQGRDLDRQERLQSAQTIATGNQAAAADRAREAGELRKDMQQMAISNRPAPKALTIPAGVVDQMAQTRATLSTIDSALGTIASGGAEGHMGPSRRVMPNWLSQVTDPGGNAIRGQVAGIGAVIRHELSGAAITPAEAKFLEPDIPAPEDRPQAAQEKLQRLRQKLQQIDADKRLQYSAENGYRNALPAGVPAAAGPKSLDSLVKR